MVGVCREEVEFKDQSQAAVTSEHGFNTKFVDFFIILFFLSLLENSSVTEILVGQFDCEVVAVKEPFLLVFMFGNWCC